MAITKFRKVFDIAQEILVQFRKVIDSKEEKERKKVKKLMHNVKNVVHVYDYMSGQKLTTFIRSKSFVRLLILKRKRAVLLG